jgi:hypothetical protein
VLKPLFFPGYCNCSAISNVVLRGRHIDTCGSRAYNTHANSCCHRGVNQCACTTRRASSATNRVGLFARAALANRKQSPKERRGLRPSEARSFVLFGNQRGYAEARPGGEVETSPHVVRLVARQCIEAPQIRMKRRVDADFGVRTHHQTGYARAVAELRALIARRTAALPLHHIGRRDMVIPTAPIARPLFLVAFLTPPVAGAGADGSAGETA